jgi:plastocyanin
MLKSLLTLVLAVAAATPALAADLTIEVRDPEGRPVPDAVILIRPATGAPPKPPAKFSWPSAVSQQNIAFTPTVLIAPLGGTVAFPNKDKVRHHVYSFSPVKKFELKLYGRDETRSVTFDKPGPVSLGCNIHDQMVGYVYVSDTAHASKTNASGVAVIPGVAAGRVVVSGWTPALRTREALLSNLAVGAGPQRIAVVLNAAAPKR